MGVRLGVAIGTAALVGGLAGVALMGVLASSSDQASPTTASSATAQPAASTGPAPEAPTLRPERVILTPTTDPATSQTITWSQSAGEEAPSVTFVAPGVAERTVGAVRRPATSVEFSGTDQPRYSATLTDLRADTTYSYWISSAAGESARHTFTTAAEGMPEGGWRFLAFGDTQLENATTVKDIIDEAIAEAPDADLAVQVGDVVNTPTADDEWRDMFHAMGDLALTRNWLVSIGNHEQCVLTACDSNEAEAFRSYFSWPDNGHPDQGETWFSVDYQGVRFVVLDPFGGEVDEQADFLEEMLASNPNRWSVVVEHAPPFAPRPGRPNPGIRKAWGSIIEAHDVDLVLSGHDHSYARASVRRNGPVYVVSVSGPKFYPANDADFVGNGATLAVAAARTPTYQVITIDEQRLHYRAVVVDIDGEPTGSPGTGETLDEFTISKEPDGSGKRVTSPPLAGGAAD